MNEKYKPKVGDILYRVESKIRGPGIPAEVTVKSVGHKYFTVTYGPHQYTESTHHIKSWLQVTDYTPSYYLYTNKEEYDNEIIKNRIINEIKNAVRDYGNPLNKLSLEDLNKIKTLLNIN
jgi:hypothetical protein